MKKILALALTVCMLTCMVSCGGSKLFLATGSETGTYYAFGNAFTQVLKDKIGLNFTVQSSGASKANILLIDSEEVDLAIVQNDVMDYAYNGTNTFAADGAIKSFAAICAMYPESIQIVAKPGINSVADLAGKTVSVGDIGSGTEFNAAQIFEAYGLSFDDIQKQNLGFTDSADKFKDGQLDAFFVTAGAPTNAITELATTSVDFTILSIGEAELAYLQENYGYYTVYNMPQNTYSVLDADVTTVAVMAALICDADLDEQTVYDITKGIFENMDAITAQHAKGAELSLEKALDGLSTPIHPGALKYFNEKGISVE